MFHYTKAVFANFFQIIGGYLGWISNNAKHPERKPLDKRYKQLRKFIRRISAKLNIKFYVKGLENLPADQVCCFFANHSSFYDPLSIISVLESPTTFVAKKETLKMPLIGKCLAGIDGEFMDRSDLKQSFEVIRNVNLDLARKNKNWLIFPEGTRKKDVLLPLLEFHHGTFKVVHKSGALIVPVAIYGTARILKMKPQFKEYPVQITFLKPIPKEVYETLKTEEVAAMVKEQIEREIYYNMKPFDHQIMIKQKKYRFNSLS